MAPVCKVDNMKKCFTINPFRTSNDILSYRPLFEERVYEGIEIFYPYNIEENKQNIYTRNIKQIAKEFPFIEIVLHLPFGRANNLCDMRHIEKTLKIMRESIDYAEGFSVKKLTLHLGYVDQKLSRGDNLFHIKKILVSLLDYARRYDMIIMIENMPSVAELGYGPEEIKTIITDLNDGNLKFILDTGHAHLSGYTPAEYIRVLANELYHIHFNDNDGTADQHARLGNGTIDFYAVFRALKAINYHGLHCLEILFNNVIDLRQNAADMDKYAPPF